MENEGRDTPTQSVRELRAVKAESQTVAIDGTERAEFRFCSPRRQYVRLRLDHPGVPLTIAVKNTATTQHFRGDWQAPTLASFETESEACLEISVRPLEPQNEAIRLRLTVDEIRDLAAKDAACLRAQQSFQRGMEFSSQWTGPALRRAILQFHAAAVGWEQCGEVRLSAMSWSRIGYARSLLSEYPRARANYQKGLAMARASGDASQHAEALTGLAQLTWNTPQARQGIEMAASAALLARAHRLPGAELMAINAEAKLRYAGGELPRALLLVQDVATRAREEGNLAAEAQALSIAGYIQNSLADFSRALSSEQEALRLWRTTGNAYETKLATKFVGSVYTNLGEKQKSFDYALQALEGFRRLGSRYGQMTAMVDLAYYYEAVGDFHRAQDFYERAARVAGQLQQPRFVGELQGYVAQMRQNRGDFRGALRDDTQTLQMVRKLGDRREEAWALLRIGWAHHELGDDVRAETSIKQALGIFRATTDKRGESEAWLRLGRLQLHTGRLGEARESVEGALAISRATQDPFRLLEGQLLSARIEMRSNNLEKALTLLRGSLDLAETLRSRLSNPSNRALFQTTIHALYSTYIEALMSGSPGEARAVAAFEASERGRARTLLELLAEARAGLHSGVPPELAERERRTRASLDALAERQITLLSGPHTAAEVEAMDNRIRELTAEYDQIESQIRSANPRLVSLANPQPLTAGEIQAQLLDSQTVLLEFALGEERSYLWKLTPEAVESFVLPRRSEIEKSARRVRELLTARQEQSAQGVSRTDAALQGELARLGESLLGKVANKLGGKRLLIVPDGALHYIPFAALPLQRESGGGALFEEHEIVVLPSASTLALLHRTLVESGGSQPIALRSVAIFADPVFELDDPRVAMTKGTTPSDAPSGRRAAGTSPRALRDVGWNLFGGRIPRLPATREEAETVFAFADRQVSFKALDFDANRESAMREDLRQYRVVHFATHGFVNAQHPELSGVLLSLVDRRGKPRNGFLRLQDVYDLRFQADLVVLSACNTALGKEMRGEGMVGLTRGFFYAGAARVLSTLWKVDDEATADFMRHFYRSMLGEGKSPAASLREAQLALRKQPRWRSPYYWAAFVIQGEYR